MGRARFSQSLVRMNEISQPEAPVGTQKWDALVKGALAASGVDGTALLSAGPHERPVPHGLSALISALLHFLAPELPRRMRVYTYDLVHVGSLLEVRGARALTALPDPLLELAGQLGVTLNFHRQGSASSVMLTLPVHGG